VELREPAARRGDPTQQFGEYDAAFGGWTLDGEPYTSAPGSTFDWFRSRMLGGRTNHWGRISLRFGPDDFRRKSLDGLGDDWPITYDDLKPFYDEVDKFVGIFGTNLGPRFPNEPDGFFMPPPAPRCYELPDQAGVREDGDSVRARRGCRSSRGRTTTGSLPLLRPVQPRLRAALELLVTLGAAAAAMKTGR
jgi:choline dehydrogenase-like flavoprotein